MEPMNEYWWLGSYRTLAIFYNTSMTKYLTLQKTRLKMKSAIKKKKIHYIVLIVKTVLFVLFVFPVRAPKSACKLILQIKPIHCSEPPYEPSIFLLTLEQRRCNSFPSHWRKELTWMRAEGWLKGVMTQDTKWKKLLCKLLRKAS